MAESANPTTGGSVAGAMLRITPPGTWMALAGLILLVGAALFWSFNGQLPVEVPGKGFLVPFGGMERARTFTAGVVASLAVKVGDTVQEGQVIGELFPQMAGVSKEASLPALSPQIDLARLPSRVPVVCPIDGKVLQIVADEGDWVEAGEGLVTLSRGTEETRRAWMFVPFRRGPELHQGMEVFMELDSVPSESHGFLEGRVYSVAQFPATAQDVSDVFGRGSPWVNYFLGNDTEPVVKVVVDLVPDKTPSGYHWTMGSGPDLRDIIPGTMFNGNIRTSTVKPITVALP